MRFQKALESVFCVFSIVVVFSGTTRSYFEEEENYPRYLTAAVGDYIVFDCEIDFPQPYPIPYRLYWKRGVSNFNNILVEYQLSCQKGGFNISLRHVFQL